MAIETCPHCFRKVLPTQDRRCPTCSERVDIGPGDERAGHELVWFGKTTRLPDICVVCGIPTGKRMTLQVSSVGRARAFFENLENPILAVLGLFRPEMVVSEDAWRMVRMVPCCRRCKTASPPAIHTIDHHTFRLGILVRNDIARMLHGRR